MDKHQMPQAIAASERFVIFIMPLGMGLEISDSTTKSLGWIPNGEYCDKVISNIREMSAKMAAGEIDEEEFDDSVDSIETFSAPSSLN